MKDKYLIVLGDIHGTSKWEQVVKDEAKADKIIFIGDYADSFFIAPEWQIANLKSILEFKRQNPEKVILLIGNHDFHYMVDGERYSGYNHEYAQEFHDLYAEALHDGLLQVAYSHGKYLFSHAGITKTWLEDNFDLQPKDDIAHYVNVKFELTEEMGWEPFTYDRRDLSGYGESVKQGPLWVRPESLRKDLPKGYTQVVGHTQQKTIKYEKGLILIDTASHEYLRINNGKTSTVICE